MSNLDDSRHSGEDPEAPHASAGGLFASVRSGTRWTTAGHLGNQLGQFGVIAVLARLLAPEDFGLMAMAMALIGLLEVFEALGTNRAIIQSRMISKEMLSSVFFLNCFIGLILCIALSLGGFVVAWVYDEPRLSDVIQVLGLSLVFSSLGLVHKALLERAMRFDQLAAIGWVGTLANGATAISLALSGWAVWALVAGSLARTVLTTAMVWWLSAWRPSAVFRLREIRSIGRFSLFLTGTSVVELFARNAVIFVIGRFLGATSLGYFSLVTRLLAYPMEAVSGTLRKVLFPALSSIQHDDSQIGKLYLRACNGIAFIMLPMMAGLAVLAEPFIHTVLGEAWAPVVPLVLILAPVGALNSLLATVGVIYMVKGRTDWLFRWQVVFSVCILLSFVLGSHWGLNAAAMVYGITALTLAVPGFSIPLRLVGLGVGDLARNLRPYLAASAAMALVVLACRVVTEQRGLAAVAVLIAATVGGGVAYTGLVLLMKPPALDDFLHLLGARRPDAMRRKLDHV